MISEVKRNERPKLFISYSHVDTQCVERLLVHLKPLERANTVVCWSDKRLRTGDKWKAEIEQNLNEAVIAVLLISADFLASDFIVNNELPPLLVKADSNGLRILPVIVKPCGFRRDPILSTFQAANDPATPLLGMTPIEQEALYDKIADEVAKEIANRRVS
nr:toll/interleukin-1 receptor domain-containing protein [Ramlibacter henchirensis]